MPGDGTERSTCSTVGCHREAVVIHSFAPGDPDPKSERAALCLPCRRVLQYAMRIPWGDESEQWRDKSALKDFNEGDLVRSERYVHTDPDGNGGGA